MYYLRSKPSVNPVKFSIKKKLVEKVDEPIDETASVNSEESLGFNASTLPPRKNSTNPSTGDKENMKELPVISARHILGLKQDTVQKVDEEEEVEGCVMCSS